MKKQMLSTFAILAVMITVSGVSAYAQERVTASVPFAFNVGNTTLSAGDYTLTQLSPESWSVRNESDSREGVLTVVSPSKWNKVDDQGKLVFKQYGDRYFLYEISAGSQALQIPSSKIEREMARHGASPEYAYVPEARR